MSDTNLIPDAPNPTPDAPATPVVVDHTARLADLESALSAKVGEYDKAMAASADLAKKLEALVTERDAATAAVTRLARISHQVKGIPAVRARLEPV